MGSQTTISPREKELKTRISAAIDPIQLKGLAKESKLVQRRSSKICGDEFLQALVVQAMSGTKNTLGGTVDVLKEIKESSDMSIQALWKRMNSFAALLFLQLVFARVLASTMKRGRRQAAQASGLFNYFCKVYLHDSTESLLHPALKDDFKGSGGGSGNGKGDASVKVDLIYEYKENIICHTKITDRREPDSVLESAIMAFVEPGCLVIRDLGYSVMAGFQRIREAGAFFLSRLHSSVLVYLSESDEQPVQLGDFLKKRANKNGVVDTDVYISKAKVPCRLIAYRVPRKLQRQRLTEYQRECKKRTRAPCKEYIKRSAFTIFITNVPATVWEPEWVGTAYRIRWQVELIFKSWKSDLAFDCLPGKLPNRITCIIYAKLIGILLVFTVHASVNKLAHETLGREVSMHKVVTWLTRGDRFLMLLLHGITAQFLKELERALKRLLCKDLRKRKTSKQVIDQKEPYGFSSRCA